MSDNVNNMVKPPVQVPKQSHNTGKFPMAKILIKGSLRPHVVAFFAFMRECDDLSDNPDIMPGDKLAKLAAMEGALRGENNDPECDTALRMAASINVTGVGLKQCFDVIEAVKQDVAKSRYENWDELLGYCNLSAAPAGRFITNLYKDSEKIYPLADALCQALQIINHIQDAREDYINLDRVYLPQDVLMDHGVAISDLEKDHCTPELRGAIDICLEKVESLIEQATPLPQEVKSRSLGLEVAVMIKVAKRLCKSLRNNDPLSAPVKLNRFQYMSAGFRGVFSFPSA